MPGRVRTNWRSRSPRRASCRKEEKTEAEEPAPTTTEDGDKVTLQVRSHFHLAQISEGAAAETPANEKPPVEAKKGPKPKVKVTVNDDGQLVIISDDPGAIDQMQELIDQLAPPQPEFKYYRLVYIASDDMKEILETYFLEDLAEDDRDDDWRVRLFGGGNEEEEPATLGKRRKLRFIDDYYSNTLIVSNASPSQMRIIDKMIKTVRRRNGSRKGFDERHDYYREGEILTGVGYRQVAQGSVCRPAEFQGQGIPRSGGSAIFIGIQRGRSDTCSADAEGARLTV